MLGESLGEILEQVHRDLVIATTQREHAQARRPVTFGDLETPEDVAVTLPDPKRRGGKRDAGVNIKRKAKGLLLDLRTEILDNDRHDLVEIVNMIQAELDEILEKKA